MRRWVATLALLAAGLQPGHASERGYFPGRGHVPERGYFPGYVPERGYFPQRHPAPQAAPPPPLAPGRPLGDPLPRRVAPPIAEPPVAEPLAPLRPEPRSARPARTGARSVGVPPAGGSRWRPPTLQRITPEVGTPEWEREKVETERRERDLNRTLRGICSGC